MTRILLFVCLIFQCAQLFCQDSTRVLEGYYINDKIGLTIYRQQYTEARQLYLSHPNDNLLSPLQCFTFADAFLKCNDTTLAKRLVNVGFSKGTTWQWLSEYPKLKATFSFADSLYYSNTIKEARNKIDIDLYAQLAAMTSTDQYIRGKWIHDQTNKVYLQLEKETDSINSAAVFKIIEKQGWLGYNTQPLEQKLMPLFLHVTSSQLDSTHFETYRKIIFKEVLRGNMSPDAYSFWVDRYYSMHLKRSEVYGCFWKRTAKGSELNSDVQNPDSLDKRRRSIGLLSLKEYLEQHPTFVKPSWYN